MQIISRAEWGARAPKSRSTVAWSSRTEFVVHYSAASTSQTPKVIQAYHMDTRGWSDIGYNFLVDQAGKIYEGRGWTVLGAHATGHNTSGIGVCFIGKDGDATDAARAAIRWLYDQANAKAGKTLTRRGHRDVGSTSCPGDKLYAWVKAGMSATGSGGGSSAPSTPKPTTPSWTETAVNALPTLKKGSKGTPVKRLQALLNVAGQKLAEDGDFGAKTAAAVVSYQAKNKIKNSVSNGKGDGIVGRYTWTALLGV